MLEAEGGAQDVDLEHRPDLLRGDLGEQAGDLDAGVVDQQIEAAQQVDGRTDRVLPAALVGDVELDEPVAAAEVVGDPLAGLGLEIADHHGGAGGDQCSGHALAETLGPAGDQCLASGQIENAHGLLLQRG